MAPILDFLGGVGVAEVLIVFVMFAILGGGALLAIVLAMRAVQGPKNCAHCGKPLR